VTELGADHVIDTRTEDFDTAAAAYDVVVDTVGGQTLERSFSATGWRRLFFTVRSRHTTRDSGS